MAAVGLMRPLLCGRAAAAQGQLERAGAHDHGADAEELRHAQRAAGVQGAPAANPCNTQASTTQWTYTDRSQRPTAATPGGHGCPPVPALPASARRRAQA